MLSSAQDLIKGLKKFKYACVILTDEEEYLYLLESYYQNVQVSGEKWHMSHLISCPIVWEIDSKLISVQLDHPVSIMLTILNLGKNWYLMTHPPNLSDLILEKIDM